MKARLALCSIVGLTSALALGCGGLGSSATCNGPAPAACWDALGQGRCGDIQMSPVCTNGSWACPGSLVPESQCQCTGLPPPGCCMGGASCCPCPSVDGGPDAVD